jgi:hypothetical protein
VLPLPHGRADPSPPRNTGPIELRDFGPMDRRLGTDADCYDGSPWELHRGELVEQIGGKDIHGIAMVLLAALFRTHARDGLTVMIDVYCALTDAEGPARCGAGGRNLRPRGGFALRRRLGPRAAQTSPTHRLT